MNKGYEHTRRNGGRLLPRPSSERVCAALIGVGFCLATLATMPAVAQQELAAARAASQQVSTVNPLPMDTLARAKTYMKRRWGIEVIWVREAAAGYMLEFRYKVLDAAKAEALFDRQTKPVLIHENSGAQMIVPTPPKTGALRNSNKPQQGRTYWMFFANPGKYIKSGDLVSIQIGDYLQQQISVQ